MKCFYHSADLDGKCSAAIVNYKHQGFGIDLIGINYGEEFPWCKVEDGELVYMVDFALQPFSKMIMLDNKVDLIWIDHHKTAIDDEKKYGIKFNGLRRIGTGACALVWEYLFNNDIPEGVRLLAEYDVWNHQNPKTLPFQYGLRVCDTEPKSGIWRSTVFTGNGVDKICQNGSLLLDYETSQNKIQASAKCFEIEFDGLKCIAMNHGPANSKVFDSVWDPKKYDAMMPFYWNGRFWLVSLYSDRDDVDVSAVAKKRGGGGHKGAAGFQSDKPPMELGPIV